MQKTVLVTGATGHLGACLVRDLIKKDYNVKVLIRRTSPLDGIEGLKIEFVYGDVNDKSSFEKALDGVDYVIHMAAVVDIGRDRNDLMRKVNYYGTKNVVDACCEAKIERMVYVSTSHVVECAHGNRKGNVIFETDEFDIKLAEDGYGRSKLLGTQYVFNAIKTRGLNAVVTYPSAVIGPFAYRISNTHQLFIEYIKGKLPASVNGSYSFVDVRDVSFGIISALEKGRIGEGYLLTAETVTIPRLFRWMEEKTKVKRPKFNCPLKLAIFFSPLAELGYRMRNVKPLFSKVALKTLDTNCEFSCEKAKKELGYKPMDIKQSVFDSIDFALEHNQATINKRKLIKDKKITKVIQKNAKYCKKEDIKKEKIIKKIAKQ